MKKKLAGFLTGAVALATVVGSITSIGAVDNSKSLRMLRFQEDAGYSVPLCVDYQETEDEMKTVFVEPNYFRTTDGDVAYCVEGWKKEPSSVKLSDKTISLEGYNVIKNGYPLKSGADYGVSDVELEYATTFAIKAVEGKGESWTLDDLNNEVKAVTGYETEAEEMKGLIKTLMEKGTTTPYDSFTVDASSATVAVDGDYYKAGPYVVNTNLSGKTTYDLNGAPAGTSVAIDGNKYYVNVPKSAVTSDLSFSIIFENTEKMLKNNLYTPENEDEQSMFIAVKSDAKVSQDINIVPERKGVIKITKTDDSGTALKGVEFTIFNSEDKEVEKIVTNDAGVATSSQLSLGEYTVKETKTLDGYVLSQEEMKFTLTTEANKIVTEVNKTVINKKNEVTITKVIKGTDTGLKDAVLEIYDSNNKLVSTLTTDKDGKASVSGLAAGKYTIKEKTAPKGYKLSKDSVSFEIDVYGKVTGTTKLENEVMSVEIKKVDSSDKPLEGATIEVRDANKELVFAGTTDSKGIAKIEKLIAGTYTVTETKPPAGYQLKADSIKFTIDEYGKVTGDTKLTNELTKVTIIKKDSADNKVLKGAEIIIKNSSGSVVYQGKTDENGKIEVTGLAPGIYVFYENQAPEGYIKTNEKSTFTINSKGENLELTIFNEKFVLESGKNNTSSSTTSTTNSGSSSEIIKTGVEENVVNMIPLYILIVASTIAIGFVVYKRKKETKIS